MFWFARRELRFVVDCADARRLRALCEGPRPRGVRVRARHATRLHDDTVSPVLRAEVIASCSCSPLEVSAWLGACFAGCEDLWYVDGVPARSGGRPQRVELGRLAALFAP
ncbi:MAG TPA: hypothetical protein PJ986_11215 [Gammaproteobacteria bacterium]|nr:hypothetical protein [Gammaproteobacteria bacterium]